MTKVITRTLLAGGIVLCSATLSFAGSCLENGGAATQTAVEEFSNSPATLVGGNRAESDVIDQVRLLTATETDLAGKMLDLGASDATTPSQKAAIGAGLGRAANVCRIAHPDLADAIAKALAEALLTNPALAGVQTAFLQALSGQTATAALGPGAAASPASGITANSPATITGGGEGGTATGINGTPTDTSNQLRVSRAGGGNFSTEIIQQVSRTGI